MSDLTPAVQETALLQVEQLQQIVATAPQILAQNIESKTKAIEAGQKLIELAKAGMNDVYDAQLATFISKVKNTVDLMNERRKPFTQIVNAVAKQFTTLEGELKPIIDESQELRNAWATTKMLVKQEEERIAKLKLEKDKELIEIRKTTEILISGFFNECLSKTKNSIVEFFNTLTLENIDSADEVLKTTSTKFDIRYEVPTNINLGMQIRYASEEEVNGIISELLSADYSAKKREYTFELEGVIKEYRDKLPSKKTELQAIANANVEEKMKLEAAALKRQQEEAEKLRKQQEERELKAQEEASINASAATAGAMIDAGAATSETPNVKEGYAITLKSNAGYLLLVQFWFEKEGKGLAIDKFEKITFDRMKRFCEAYAAKNEEFIQSPLIEYKPVYKAK